jgi:hypothetical protein
MCFSAEASFTAAAVLGVAGCLCIRKVHCKKLYWLAVIPLLFGLQQLFEGFLWLTIGRTDVPHLLVIEKYGFLFFALFVWPIWIPLAMFIAEKVSWRKKLLGLFLIAGIAYTVSLLWQLLAAWQTQSPSVTIMGESIRYALPIENRVSNAWNYLAVALLPSFLSSLRGIWWFGVSNVIGVLIAQYFYENSFISVWCFFAAWVSLILYFVLSKNEIECNLETHPL